MMYNSLMRDLNVTDFRRQCLSLLEGLPKEGIVVSKRGRPLARIMPLRSARRGERVTLPLLKGKGKRGPLCPGTETPYDLVFD
jgi:antitoxin (DNA-binding transcriptional repressor) of toxin-antitoxin stability system